MSYVNSTAIISVASVMPALGIIAVAVRFLIRKQQKLGFGADDWLIVPALIVTVGIGVLLLYGTLGAHNLGYPTKDFTPTSDSLQIVVNLKIEMAIFMMQAAALGFAKLSITCFYRRIFNTGATRAFDIFTKILLFIIFGWSLSWILAYALACRDRVYLQWGSYDDQLASCGVAVIKESFFVAADLVVDVILFITPIPLIARLHISKLRRFAIILIFCMGMLTVVTSIIRVVFLSLIYQRKLNALSTADQDLEISTFGFWTMLETGLSVIVACLPTFSFWLRSVSTNTISKHVRGFFSVRSFTRRSDDTFVEERSQDRSTVRSEKENYVTEL